jgi:hypothetical protein
MKSISRQKCRSIHNRKGCSWNTINDLVFNSVSVREIFLVEASTRDHLLSVVTAKLSRMRN